MLSNGDSQCRNPVCRILFVYLDKSATILFPHFFNGRVRHSQVRTNKCLKETGISVPLLLSLSCRSRLDNPTFIYIYIYFKCLYNVCSGPSVINLFTRSPLAYEYIISGTNTYPPPPPHEGNTVLYHCHHH